MARGAKQKPPRLKRKFELDCLTKKADPPPICGVKRDSGMASANAGLVHPFVCYYRVNQMVSHLNG
ncbi:MAG: hypothetical protein WAO02_11025, partial [Verrucomicrobiia bacterium]